jgi:ribosomal protein L37AE/L43A
MSFDNIPENKKESFPCGCGGSITLDLKINIWECDECNYTSEKTK